MNATATMPEGSEHDRTWVEIGNILAETSKIQAETVKLQADTRETNARTAKLMKEAAWYPVVVGTGLVAAGAALAKFFF